VRALFWLLVAIGLAYAFYVGAVAVWQYYEIKGIVEEVVGESMPAERFGRTALVTGNILRKAAATGIVLDERGVFVTEENRQLRVLIRWSYPAIVFRGEVKLSIPLAFHGSFPIQTTR